MRVALATGSRIYGGAQVNRLTVDWPITITSANAEILVSAIALRSRLRQLERDDDYFRSMLSILENNVIGDHGLNLRMKMRKKNGDYRLKKNRRIHDAWKEYMEPGNCTVMGNLFGIELQRNAVRALARDGAILFRRYKNFPGNPFRYALEPIEIDRLDHQWSRPSANGENDIQFGLEFDQYKRVIAYHILTRHPGEVYAWRSGPKYRERVPADEIFGLWSIERAGQVIGMPLWPSVARRLHHLAMYEESEAIASRMAANKGGWFEKSGEGAEYVGSSEDQDGNKLLNTEPGQWEELPAGWKAVTNDPNHPTDAYAFFVKGQLRGAASGANLPYNSVANDLENVNYSSIRAGLLEARDGFRWLQKLVHHRFIKLWFRDWLPYALMSGQIQGMDITDYQEIISNAHWQGRRWPWVDPLKDVQADLMAIDGGLDSRSNICAENGRDYEDVLEEQEQDELAARKRGITFATPNKPVLEPADDANDFQDRNRVFRPRVVTG